MKSSFRTIIPFCVLAFVTTGDAQHAGTKKLNHPDARRVNAADEYFGVTVPDPYRWLEDMNSDETIRWIRAQDELTSEFVRDVPVRSTLEERIRNMWETGRVTTPSRGGDAYFFTRTEPDSTVPVVHVVHGLDNHPEVFFRTSTAFDLERRPFRGIQPSPDGRFILFQEGLGQSRWRHLLIMDVAERRFLPDRLTGYYSGRGGVAWTRDGRGFYYTRYATPDPDEVMETTVKNSKIFFHTVGTPQSDDRLVFEVPDEPLWLYWPRVTLDGRYLVIIEGSAPETRVFLKDLSDPRNEVTALIPEADATYNFEASKGSRLLFRTTLDAPNSRLLEIDVEAPDRSNWTEVIAEEPDADLRIVGYVGGRLILRYVRDARPFVRVHDFSGTFLYDVALPSIGLIGGFPDDERSTVFYRFNSLFDPGSVYRFNVESGENEVFARPHLSFDPADFEMNQVFFESRDGTRVPMFIAYRKGLQKSATNPVFLYGYGAYKWSAFPWYQPHVLAWMEMGGLYAMPGIRGGGEYGEAWYQAGIRERKQTGIDDYLSAAEYLVAEGYTSRSLLVANGGSASGVLAGAAVVQRPDLFGAAVIDVPALDMLRYQHFGSALNWVPEFGSSDDESQFAALRAYSPYHNVESGVCYPPSLTTVGELDDTTAPMHGYKFTAALQHAQACDNPVLLKVMWGTGHATSYGNTNEQRAVNASEILSFLVKVLDFDGG